MLFSSLREVKIIGYLFKIFKVNSMVWNEKMRRKEISNNWISMKDELHTPSVHPLSFVHLFRSLYWSIFLNFLDKDTITELIYLEKNRYTHSHSNRDENINNQNCCWSGKIDVKNFSHLFYSMLLTINWDEYQYHITMAFRVHLVQILRIRKTWNRQSWSLLEMIFFAHVEITDLQFNFQGHFRNDQLLIFSI